MANRKERRAAARSKDSNDTDNAAVEPDAVLGGGAEGFGEGEAMPFPDHEEDVLFKTQMRVLNLLLGHWKTGLAIVGTILLGVLIVGEYNEYMTSQQRGFQGEIADVDRRMPAPSPTERLGLDGMGITDEVKANVEEGARRYEAVGGSATGTASTMAWLRAGAAWERAGATDKAMAAYGSTQAASGDVDGAIATLQSLSGRVSGLASEHAEIGVATILEDAGRTAESKAAFSAFLVAHPDSVLVGQANDGIHRLGEAG